MKQKVIKLSPIETTVEKHGSVTICFIDDSWFPLSIYIHLRCRFIALDKRGFDDN